LKDISVEMKREREREIEKREGGQQKLTSFFLQNQQNSKPLLSLTQKLTSN